MFLRPSKTLTISQSGSVINPQASNFKANSLFWLQKSVSNIGDCMCGLGHVLFRIRNSDPDSVTGSAHFWASVSWWCNEEAAASLNHGRLGKYASVHSTGTSGSPALDYTDACQCTRPPWPKLWAHCAITGPFIVCCLDWEWLSLS